MGQENIFRPSGDLRHSPLANSENWVIQAWLKFSFMVYLLSKLHIFVVSAKSRKHETFMHMSLKSHQNAIKCLM